MIDITKVLLLQLQCNWQWGGKIANTQNFTTGDQMKWCQGACILHTQKHYCSKSLKIKSQKYSNSRLRSNKQIKFHKGKKNILLNIFCRKEAHRKKVPELHFLWYCIFIGVCIRLRALNSLFSGTLAMVLKDVEQLSAHQCHQVLQKLSTTIALRGSRLLKFTQDENDDVVKLRPSTIFSHFYIFCVYLLYSPYS